MVDNVTSPMPVGTILAADDVDNVLYPRTKIAHGQEGEAVDVSENTPLPVAIKDLTEIMRILARSLGVLNPDALGRLRVTGAEVTQPVTGNVGITGVGSFGIYAGVISPSYDQYGQMMQGPMQLRSAIVVT